MSSRLEQSSVPLIALASLAIVTAGNAFYGSEPDWRTARSLILWATCMLIRVARVRLGRKLADLDWEKDTERRHPGGWLREDWMTIAIGAALLLLVIVGESLPDDGGWTLSHIRLVILTPACVYLLYDWHRARSLLLAHAAARREEPATARGASAVEALLFHGIWIAVCALGVLAIGNALLIHHHLWLTMRPVVTCLLFFLILWQMQHRVIDVVSALDAAVQDDRAHLQHRSRPWAVESDPARDRAPATLAILEALDLREGMHVADVGTGGGYFATKMAERVGPTGAVIATDTSAASVARLRELSRRERLEQLRVHLVDDTCPLPALEPLDRVLLANVYLFNLADEAQGRASLRQFAESLRVDGKLVLYNEFVHEAGWVESPAWPALAASQPDAQTVIEWSGCDLVAEVPLPPPPRLAAYEKPGYLLVLKRRSLAQSGFGRVEDR
jgi:SAM-dependent methyltransferase